uniref:Ig-like domain-containing protein n=1 Tax=Knipowitschia caucasica TaxID=637954 RepID=A0AAV2M9M5_KNICA
MFGCFSLPSSCGTVPRDFSVSLPRHMEALRGSCLTIPCSFTVRKTYEQDLTSDCRSEWRKTTDSKVAFTRTTTGNLEQKNCTTTVRDITEENQAAPTPTLSPPTVSVAEGQSVRLQCSAPVPCPSLPPTLTWSPVLGQVQVTLQQQEDNTYVQESTLSFTASHILHDKSITCSAEYRREDASVTTASVQTTPSVSYGPRNTNVTVSPSGAVAEHSHMSLSCSSDANPAVQHYHWYKADGGTHTSIGNSSVLHMNASRETTAVFCQAQNELGTHRSSVTSLDVQYPPETPTVSIIPSGPVAENSHIRLICRSDANPSVFHWQRETTAVFCEVKNHLGTERSVVSQLDVQFPAQILSSSNCSGDWAQILCVCEAEGKPFPLVHWTFPAVSPNLSISTRFSCRRLDRRENSASRGCDCVGCVDYTALCPQKSKSGSCSASVCGCGFEPNTTLKLEM